MSDDHDFHIQPMAVLSQPEWPGECESCRQIWQLFARSEPVDKIQLGSFDEALSTQCHRHRPLVQALIENVRENSSTPFTSERSEVYLEHGFEGDVEISALVSGVGRYWRLLVVKEDAVPHHPGTGRILNPDWVDVDMLKKWKQQCLSTHGAKCDNPIKIWPIRPTYLIDVEDKCLVPGKEGLVSDAFVALSYRYGRSSGIAIDAATLKRLHKPGALDTPDLKDCLSPIIQHAMHLTSAISERYLWADAICIPQDNEEVRKNELKMMGAIYANAVVTIIATDGDSQDGLPGLEGASEPRQMKQCIIPFGSEEIILANHDSFDTSGRGNDYSNRAWTFQEYLMSKRRIIFKNNELHWHCQCSVWHENMILDAEIDHAQLNTEHNVIMAGFPDLEILKDTIFRYNIRELRYEEDALPAVSGILSVLSRSFTGGFLYGIPEMFFERGLGWRPGRDCTDLRRRTLSERPVENRLSPSGLPSWSWIGWQGWVDLYPGGEASRIVDARCIITIPVTEWYTSKSPSDPLENRRRISSTWFENRDRYNDLAQPLPPGWSRHDASVTSRCVCKSRVCADGYECGRYIFSHVDMPGPDGDTGYWYYPFPVPKVQDSTPPITPEQTPYLFCKTSRARLWGRQTSKGNIVHLYNSSGRAVGYLHLHNKDSLALFPRTISEAGHGLSVELVVVYKSRRFWPASYTSRVRKWFDDLLDMEDGYVVLWVEWTDGVAYRLASGAVKTEEWEKLDTESIDLILG